MKNYLTLDGILYNKNISGGSKYSVCGIQRNIGQKNKKQGINSRESNGSQKEEVVQSQVKPKIGLKYLWGFTFTLLVNIYSSVYILLVVPNSKHNRYKFLIM